MKHTRLRKNKYTWLGLALIAMCMWSASLAGAQSAPGNASTFSADEIIKKTEQLMYPNSKTDMKLESTYNGKIELYSFTSYARDNNQKIIVRFTAPASMVGSDLLMLDRNVWLYDPKSSREMKIPANQSFGGTGFSYGDILRLNFSDNFTASILSENADSWVLNLDAKLRDAPYHRIELTVSKQFYILLGKCYSRSGDLVKTMEYSKIADVGGGLKPLVVRVSSPLDPKEYSILTIVKESPKTYALNIFNKKNLSARMEEK